MSDTPDPVGPTPTATPPPSPPERGPEDRDWKAETDKWRHLSRENEKQAKAVQAELEELRRKSMSDNERALAEAREQGKAERSADVTSLQVENERLRVAIDKNLPSALVDRLRGDTREALEKDADQLLALFAPKPADPAKPPATDLGQGRREGAPASSVAAGIERGKRDLEAAQAQQRDPWAGMRRLGGP